MRIVKILKDVKTVRVLGYHNYILDRGSVVLRLLLLDQEDLKVHVMETIHATFKCNVCKKTVAVSRIVEHINMHNTKERFNQVISEPVKKKPTQRQKGWTLFLREKKAELRRINPVITHQQATNQVSSMWKCLTKASQHAWNLRATSMPEGVEPDQALEPETSRNNASNEATATNPASPAANVEPVVTLTTEVSQRTDWEVNNDDAVEEAIEEANTDSAETANTATTESTKRPNEEGGSKKSKQSQLFKCPKCGRMKTTKVLLKSHMYIEHNYHEDTEDEEDDPKVFVMVKRRKLWWPAMVLDDQGSVIRLVTYEKDSPELTVHRDDTQRMTPATQPGK